VGVEARRPAAGPSRLPSVLREWWPFALLIALVVLGLLLLALRLVPPGGGVPAFALVERRPGPPSDAAAPATCELTRRARVICPDGEEGRLAHVVVQPRTGALLRLVVRDRGEVLREVPARLIVSTSPAVVRLSPTWPELQELLAARPPFRPRRYKKLPIERRRPPDVGPLLQATTDSLRIEVEGAPRL
jgi:hypothetical protein